MRGLLLQWESQKAERDVGDQLIQGFSNLRVYWTHLKIWWNTNCWIATKSSDSLVLGSGWGLSICLHNTFSSEADIAGPGTTLWKPLNPPIIEGFLRLGAGRGSPQARLRDGITGKLRPALRSPGALPLSPSIRMKRITFVTNHRQPQFLWHSFHPEEAATTPSWSELVS